MNEEYKDTVVKKIELLKLSSDEVEKIIDLINESNILNVETRTRASAFLEGYMTGLKEQIEWLNCFMWDLDTVGKE